MLCLPHSEELNLEPKLKINPLSLTLLFVRVFFLITVREIKPEQCLTHEQILLEFFKYILGTTVASENLY